MIPDNVSPLISPNGSATTFFEFLKTLGSIAGIIALVWTVRNNMPQIKVTFRESFYYDELSKDPKTRIGVISIANRGKVPIKIESSGFIVNEAEMEILILNTYPPKTLISGERCDRYHDSNELAKSLSTDLGIMLEFGNIVKMRAFCKDQTGKFYKSKIFRFDVELKEGNVPRLLNYGTKQEKIVTYRKGASFYNSLYKLKQRWHKLLGDDQFKRRAEYAISKHQQKKLKK